jgi:asparagine synthase (glutamine-hydrolysing)
MFANLDACIGAMSEPMVSHDNVGFYLLSREVAKHVKVVQSGQGADEVFAGYHWYPKIAAAVDGEAAYREFFFDRGFAEYAQTVGANWVNGDFAGRFVQEQFATTEADSAVDRALRLDTTVMLVEDPVKRVDNQTMAWSLEARVPFLDHELVEFAGQIPAPLKLADEGKGILKSLARRYLPAEVIDRPKGYFPVPALKYLQGHTLAYVRELLTSPTAKQRGLYRSEYMERLFQEPEGHITPLGGSKLWQLGLLEAWLQKHQF